jgi:exopolysaccharide production protein ExoQ
LKFLILLTFLAFAGWLIRRDKAQREGISSAIWIPTIWVAIIASRPLSMWLGFGGGTDTLEGSPLDRAFYFIMIAAALIVVSRRRVNWSAVIAQNWPVFLFYGYLLISVLWANDPLVSFKRWLKEFGNIAVLLVILSEINPEEAFRAVFVRCGYVLIPLSIIFIRYFAALGRTYNLHSGGMEATGVTTQKNSLGVMVLVCCVVLIWEWMERSKLGWRVQGKFDRYFPLVILLIGVWLLKLADSKTSIACLFLAAVILASVRLPLFRRKVTAFGGYAFVAIIAFFLLNWMVGIIEPIVHMFGRDMTFTGRTDVWRELLALKTNPVFGTGFCSFWDNQYYRSRLPSWVAFSAHNGYLETYLDGGMVGLFFLGLMLLTLAFKLNRQLSSGSNYAVVRFTVLLITIIANFSESNFGRMTLLGFLFLLAAIDIPRSRNSAGDQDLVDRVEGEGQSYRAAELVQI